MTGRNARRLFGVLLFGYEAIAIATEILRDAGITERALPTLTNLTRRRPALQYVFNGLLDLHWDS